MNGGIFNQTAPIAHKAQLRVFGLHLLELDATLDVLQRDKVLQQGDLVGEMRFEIA